MKFYSPYQFINTPKVNDNLVPFKDIKSGQTHIRHDRWQKFTHSGRIVCQLNTVSPIMLGGQHIGSTNNALSTHIENYRVPQNEHGKLAIPGNSLRGMIASVVETISHSSLRVLTNSDYSVRKDMSKSLHTIGQVKKNNDGKYHILPLALLTARLNKNEIKFGKWKTVFKDAPLSECLAAYVGNYRDSDNKIAGKKLSNWSSFNYKCPEFLYVKLNTKLQELNMQKTVTVNECNSSLHTKGTNMLAGQKLSHDRTDCLITEESLKKLSNDDQKTYQRGILYILGKKDREKDIPANKKHELFIPYNSEQLEKRTLIPLPGAIIETFNQLANERHDIDSKFPFVPQGIKKSKVKGYDKINFLSEGDIIYFDVNDAASKVTEISYSAIWRNKIEKNTHDYFKQLADGNHNILPWGNEERDSLTPAEALFGVVESKKKANSSASDNLASRVRFYDAINSAESISLLPDTTLKILASPKPPSPAMYFHNMHDHIVNKNTLNNTDTLPNGRKRYLHQRAVDIENQLWKSESPEEFSNQKVKCSPIDKDQQFYFHIDFDNLSDDELYLLLTAIEPRLNEKHNNDDKHFMHKIGLGKPLGLGSINIEVAGLFLVDREKRYTASAITQQSRYNDIKLTNNFSWHEQLASHYPIESKAVNEAESNNNLNTIESTKTGFIDDETMDILFKLGCRESFNKDYPVCYPFSSKHRQLPGGEKEGFKWFVNNNQNLGFTTSQNIPVLESGNTSNNKQYKKRSRSNTKKDNLFLSNIPCFANSNAKKQWENDISNALKEFGTVVRIKILSPKQGLTSAFGFATLDDQETPGASENAIAVGSITVLGTKICLKRANKT